MNRSVVLSKYAVVDLNLLTPLEVAVPVYGYVVPIVVVITVLTNSFVVFVLSRWVRRRGNGVTRPPRRSDLPCWSCPPAASWWSCRWPRRWQVCPTCPGFCTTTRSEVTRASSPRDSRPSGSGCSCLRWSRNARRAQVRLDRLLLGRGAVHRTQRGRLAHGLPGHPALPICQAARQLLLLPAHHQHGTVHRRHLPAQRAAPGSRGVGEAADTLGAPQAASFHSAQVRQTESIVIPTATNELNITSPKRVCVFKHILSHRNRTYIFSAHFWLLLFLDHIIPCCLLVIFTVLLIRTIQRMKHRRLRIIGNKQRADGSEGRIGSGREGRANWTALLCRRQHKQVADNHDADAGGRRAVHAGCRAASGVHRLPARAQRHPRPVQWPALVLLDLQRTADCAQRPPARALPIQDRRLLEHEPGVSRHSGAVAAGRAEPSGTCRHLTLAATSPQPRDQVCLIIILLLNHLSATTYL